MIPIHEVRPTGESIGIHRIIAFHNDGTPDPGQWVGVEEIALHKTGLFACASLNLPFPPGIFRVKSVAHQQLS